MTKKRSKSRARGKPSKKAPDISNPSPGPVSGRLAQFTSHEEEAKPIRFGAQLRNSFLTGLIIVGPIGITLYMVYTFVNFIDSWVKPYVPEKYNPETYLPFSIPGLGLIFAIMAIMFIGALTANLFGRSLVNYGESMLDRMPVVRNLYRALKQIFETVLSQSGNSFQKVGLIEYPRKGLYALVFVSTETKGELEARFGGGEKWLSVFLPTTPNPTSGYLLFLPARDVTVLDMTVEEGAKLVISAGLVVPEHELRHIPEGGGVIAATADNGPVPRPDINPEIDAEFGAEAEPESEAQRQASAAPAALAVAAAHSISEDESGDSDGENGAEQRDDGEEPGKNDPLSQPETA